MATDTRATFNVTFETITYESAEDGENATSGFIVEDAGLRDAIDALGCGDMVEASDSPFTNPRWLTAYKTNENHATGEYENRSIHFPDRMTASSRLRVARLLGCYGT